MSLFGPLNGTLSEATYVSNEKGEFDKQPFYVHWEVKNVFCQVHTLPLFTLYNKQQQEVRADFWKTLAPVIGVVFNFK